MQVEGATGVFVEAKLKTLLWKWHGEDGKRCGEDDHDQGHENDDEHGGDGDEDEDGRSDENCQIWTRRGRAAEVVWHSPIFSWPRIMFSKRVCYDFSTGEIIAVKKSIWREKPVPSFTSSNMQWIDLFKHQQKKAGFSPSEIFWWLLSHLVDKKVILNRK